MAKPGLGGRRISNVIFMGDNQRAASVYQGIEPLNGDIADVAFYAGEVLPEHVQIAEVHVSCYPSNNGTVTRPNL